MLEHGGKLMRAAAANGIPIERWLDLSTGVAPWQYPLPPMPSKLWHRLPETEDNLIDVAKEYYGADTIIATAGSQAAIQAIPRLIRRAKVGIAELTYTEHPHAWEKQGHAVVRLKADALVQESEHVDVMVICNPNNPTGTLLDPDQVTHLHQRLAARGGLLVVDEAFMDATSDLSVISKRPSSGLLVLRSLGKFFGLAGARVGFVAGDRSLLTQLDSELGPWTITAPSRWAAAVALVDTDWQLQQRSRLEQMSRKLATLLAEVGLRPAGSTAFFQWTTTSGARELFNRLQSHGILTRVFDDHRGLRFGLPADDSHLERLKQALQSVLCTVKSSG